LEGMKLGLGLVLLSGLFYRSTALQLFTKLRMSLNVEQTRAVTAPVMDVCVHAGPGSGKTRVLVHRVARLLQEEAIEARSILAVTFTRKAAVEMKERIGALVGQSVLKQLTVCTLHSFCCMALRAYAPSTGRDDGLDDEGNIFKASGGFFNNLDKNFSVYDGDDGKRVIKSVLESLGVDMERDFPPSLVQEVISLWKREGLAQALEQAFDHSKVWSGQGDKDDIIRSSCSTARTHGFDLSLSSAEVMAEVLSKYQKLLRFSNARDFDDIICDTLSLLQSDEPTAARLRSRYKHVLVDEWQDVDKTQYALLTALADSSGQWVLSPTGNKQSFKSIFVVGDPQQTIYSWRGADPTNMEKLKRDLPSTAAFFLETNYRSLPAIVAASRGVIAPLRAKYSLLPPSSSDVADGEQLAAAAASALAAADVATETETVTDTNTVNTTPPETEQGPPAVEVVNTYKDDEQAEFVAHMTQYLLSQRLPSELGRGGAEAEAGAEGSAYPTVAILYRRHSLSAPIEHALILRGVPYVLVGGVGLLGRKSVKDLLSYLRLLVNPRDTEALRRTINFPPRGVGASTQQAFFDMAGRVDRPVLDMLLELGEQQAEKEKEAALALALEEAEAESSDDSGSGKKKKRKPRKKKAEESGDEPPDALQLSSRQVKALGSAGTVFMDLQQLAQTWSGSIEQLLKDVLDVSGLRQRAKQAQEEEDALALAGEVRLRPSSSAAALQSKSKGKSASSGGKGVGQAEGRVNRELEMLLLLAREFEAELAAEEASLAAIANPSPSPSADDQSSSSSAPAPALARIQQFLDMLQLHAQEHEELPPAPDGSSPSTTARSSRSAQQAPHKREPVKLMSLHACKGLEFDCVLIVGLEERNLPSLRGARNSLDAGEVLVAAQADAEDDDEGETEAEGGEDEEAAAAAVPAAVPAVTGVEDDRHLDEERRLLYVGMTRAKKRLLLVYRSRMSVGLYGGSTKLMPSRFLRDLPLDVPFVRAASTPKATAKKK